MSSIPLMKPYIPELSRENINDVLESGFLVQGKYTEAVESFFKDYFNVENAIMVSNGTSSLHLALLALGIGEGDEVIVPGLSFIATANVVELVGATPVFVDVDLQSNNISPEKIEKAITSNTKAIMPVHEFGLMANMTEIKDIAIKYGLKVIEDAACALGAELNGVKSGLFGDISSFSFHPRKTITSGEGGLIITRDNDLADKMRSMRNHGFHISEGVSKVVLPGFNYRITDIQSALLHGQLQTLNDQIEKKTIIANKYNELLDDEFFLLPKPSENAQHSWQTYHVVLRKKGFDRGEILNQLRAKGIGCNFGAQCMPSEEYYQSKYKLDLEQYYPNSMYISRYGIALPLFFSMTMNDVEQVANSLNKIVKNLLKHA